MLDGSSLQDLVTALAEILGKPCAVYDASDEPLATAGAPGVDDGVVPRLLEEPCASRPGCRRRSRRTPRAARSSSGRSRRRAVLHRYLVAPILVRDERWGRLVVMGTSAYRFSGGDMLTLAPAPPRSSHCR